jgi:N-acetyl-gamma-glutamyl-phosphate reductase common form
MGGEALRVALEHPELEVAWATSRTPGPVEAHHPNLHGLGIELVAPEEATPCDVVLLAVPTEAAISAARRFLDGGARVVDLGAAFRLRSRETWERVYGTKHTDWALAEEAVYGIPELHGPALRATRLIANPGCFSSAAILALAPLVAAGCVELERLVVDGLSGTTGVGAELTRAAHHPELGSNLVAYNAVGHRHTFEMEQELSAVAGEPVRVHFTPVYVPIVRGILDVCHAFPRARLRRDEVLALLREFYADEPFVHVWDAPSPAAGSWRYEPYPWVSAVAGTNHCLIGADVDEERGRIVVLSALDSIGKGGAQVGIENVNSMLGLPRTTGLERRGLHPH